MIARWRDVFAAPKVLLALAALTVALSTLIRLFVGQGDPLWLDEAWTGAMARSWKVEVLVAPVRRVGPRPSARPISM